MIRQNTGASTKDVTRHSSLMAMLAGGDAEQSQNVELDDPNFSETNTERTADVRFM